MIDGCAPFGHVYEETYSLEWLQCMSNGMLYPASVSRDIVLAGHLLLTAGTPGIILLAERKAQ